MKIFYFGELIEDTENPKTKEIAVKQTKLQLEDKKNADGGYMQSIGELLEEIDMNLDSFRPVHMRKHTLQAA